MKILTKFNSRELEMKNRQLEMKILIKFNLRELEMKNPVTYAASRLAHPFWLVSMLLTKFLQHKLLLCGTSTSVINSLLIEFLEFNAWFLTKAAFLIFPYFGRAYMTMHILHKPPPQESWV